MKRSFFKGYPKKGKFYEPPHIRNNCNAFRKIYKNRSNHENTSTFEANGSFSKFTEKENEPNKPQSIESMREFVKSFRKDRTTVIPKHGQKKNIIDKGDNFSSRSIRSSASKFSQLSNTKRLMQEQSLQGKNLQDIEQRVQKLLERKLNKARKTDTFMKNNTKTEESEISQSLSNLVQQIESYQNKFEDNEPIPDFNKKIQLIQKIIAEGYSESEMCKKIFYKGRSIRKSLCSLEKKDYLKKSSLFRKISSPSISKIIPSLYTQSTKQASYQKPDRRAYERSPSRMQNYSLNRQPFPRSSYNTEFLFYGNLPKYSYKMENNITPNNLSKQKKQTFYQAEFKEKKVKNINPKELTCTNDKIKTLKVSFFPEKTKDKQSDLKKDMKLQKLINGKQKENRMKLSQKTVTQTQFTREYMKKKRTIDNPIKNKQLGKFKYEYKNCLHA